MSEPLNICVEDLNRSVEKVRQRVISLNRTSYAYVHSYGCQLNFSDSEKLRGMLCSMGYVMTEDENNADIILFNTCAIRENAEDRVFGNIGAIKHLKENNPNLIIGLCGCMAQESHIIEKIKQKYSFVDIIFGTHAIATFPSLVLDIWDGSRMAVDNYEYEWVDSFDREYKLVRDSDYKASVPIMYGCNNFCTYCIVPYVRGRERSRNSSDIISEVEKLVKEGYKEIMLLGQNVNSYGNDLDKSITFAELLREINKIDGDFLIRFMSSHPKDATAELIDAIADCDKVGKHIHLPLQSGSSSILERMNRKYSAEDYLKIVDYARRKMPNFSISTDIIVGFPGESDEDFSQTIDIIKRVGYDNIFSFIYSKRRGTKAAEMEDNTPEQVKTNRIRKLLELQRELAVNSNSRFIGRTLRVLADSVSRKRPKYLTGRSNEFVIVEFKAPSELIGQFVDVKITKASNWAVKGELL